MTTKTVPTPDEIIDRIRKKEFGVDSRGELHYGPTMAWLEKVADALESQRDQLNRLKQYVGRKREELDIELRDENQALHDQLNQARDFMEVFLMDHGHRCRLCAEKARVWLAANPAPTKEQPK